jgi:hypothetical protein
MVTYNAKAMCVDTGGGANITKIIDSKPWRLAYKGGVGAQKVDTIAPRCFSEVERVDLQHNT